MVLSRLGFMILLMILAFSCILSYDELSILFGPGLFVARLLDASTSSLWYEDAIAPLCCGHKQGALFYLSIIASIILQQVVDYRNQIKARERQSLMFLLSASSIYTFEGVACWLTSALDMKVRPTELASPCEWVIISHESNQSHNFYLMNKSRLVAEEKIYVKFDHSGNTQLVKSKNIEPGFSYRRIHDTHEELRQGVFSNKSELFVDREFSIDEAELPHLDPNNSRIILRRLSDLCRMCPKSYRAMLFPEKGYIPPRKLSSSPYLPTFATEMGVFPTEHYKSFFITQSFTENGFYHVIINNKGRFQTDVVDDIVPVYEESLEPIWGMELDQAWQIILLKFWAKRSGGYMKVKNAPAFNFLQCFSNSNWKYYNLQKEAYDFLSFYKDKSEVGKFVLKTKNSSLVQEAGLIPGSAGYEMINLIQTTPSNSQNVNPKDRTWIATLRSTMINKWTGHMSVLDKEINHYYEGHKRPLALDRDFMLTHTDLLNLFSTCYIASRRDEKQSHYISDYYILKVDPNNKSSIYLQFSIQNDGWLDFCVKQGDDNKIAPTAASRLKTSEFNKAEGISDGMRFLKCRFILVKENNQTSPSTFSEPDYLPPAYDTYEIEYLKGYNRGDARFLNVVKGNYILKIKPEQIGSVSYFVVNYACSSYIEMKEYFPTKKQTSAIMRQSMASLIGLMTSYHLDNTKKDQEIVYGNVFEEIGYGFVGIRSKKKCPYNILMEVDPKELQQSGYKVKNLFKKLDQAFSILIHPGQCTSIVLKKIPGAKYVWPPNGIEIYRQR